MKKLFLFLVLNFFMSSYLIASENLTFSSFYDFSKIDAQNQITLPLPNSSNLNKMYHKSMLLLTSSNTSRVEKAQMATAQLKTRDNELLEDEENSYKNSFFSLLYFISNDFAKAKYYANSSLIFAKSKDIKRTLPAFIYAYSSLNMSNFSYSDLTNRYFKYSILNEPDNSMIPLLFRLYFDKSMDSIDDVRVISLLLEIAKMKPISKFKVQNLNYMMPTYLKKLQESEESIKAFSLEANESVKNDPKSIKRLEDELKTYDKLLDSAKGVILEINASEESKKSLPYEDKLKPFIDKKASLHQKLPELKKYQKERENRSLIVAGLIFVVLVISFFLFKR